MDLLKDIKIIRLSKHTEEYKQAKLLLSSSFPKWEQSPFWALYFMSKHPGVDFLSYYTQDNTFIGTSFSIHEDSKLMILYLATSEAVRNKGYGTQIIKYLQEKDKISQTVLDIESPEQPAENAPQRLRRLNFYNRLGFHSTAHEIIEPACHYLILGTGPDQESNVQTYVQLTDKLTGGLCRLAIEKNPLKN